jgi:hypothetical protein
MKYIILLALLAVAIARPQQDDTVVSEQNENKGDGKYQWAFKTGRGIEQEATGNLKANPAKSNEPERNYDEIQAVQGAYSYPTDGKTKVSVTYTADENGYKSKTVIA